MKNDSVILTSIGLSTPNLSRYIGERFLNTQKKKVVIISTASEGKEENKYVKLAKVQFENLGFTEVIFVDLEKHESIPEDTTVIYVSGGNTYKLMKFAQESDFLSSVLKVVNQNDGIYVGVSAGSVILGNTIKGVELYDDINEVDLENLDGFSLLDAAIFPHADEDLIAEVNNINQYENVLFISNDEFKVFGISEKNI